MGPLGPVSLVLLVDRLDPVGLVAQLRAPDPGCSVHVAGMDPVQLSADDVVITETPKEGWAVATQDGETVALDLHLTPTLVRLGLARQVIRVVQEARKAAGFEVSDHIALSYEGSAKIEEIFSRFGYEILSETLGETLNRGAVGYTKEWDVNKESVTLGVEKR